jgi:hypothetical protein
MMTAPRQDVGHLAISQPPPPPSNARASWNAFRQLTRQSIIITADLHELPVQPQSPSERASGESDDTAYRDLRALPEPPYHVFDRSKKKLLVYIISLAGLFSPLSSNIYFPALGEIATVCPFVGTALPP